MPKKKRSKAIRHSPPAVGKFLLDRVASHPRDLVLITMKRFGLTRPAVHRHLAKLITQGHILKEGSKNTTGYKLATKKAGITWSLAIGKEGDEGQIWDQYFAQKVISYPKNLQDICYFGVTEMINNAIDHSQGERLTFYWNDQGSEIQMSIQDDGIGIFNRISNALGLTDPREAILHLVKGKFTTDSKRHTGQGIFFTSRMFDTFEIRSQELTYVRMRSEDDWLVETRRGSKISGTLIQMTLHKQSQLEMIDLFRRYEGDDHGFEKTDIFVKLAKLEEEVYISRSQAKRLLVGLAKFKSVVLDFSEVRSVGQGFVDEIFRVYKNAHPEVQISYVHANDDVEFIIQRGLSDADKEI